MNCLNCGSGILPDEPVEAYKTGYLCELCCGLFKQNTAYHINSCFLNRSRCLEQAFTHVDDFLIHPDIITRMTSEVYFDQAFRVTDEVAGGMRVSWSPQFAF